MRRLLESPGQISLDRLILRRTGELAGIGEADRRLRRDAKIETGFNQRGVRRERGACDAESEPVFWKASDATGVTSPKACCQARETRGVSTIPFGKG